MIELIAPEDNGLEVETSPYFLWQVDISPIIY